MSISSLTQAVNRVLDKTLNRIRVTGTLDSLELPTGYGTYRSKNVTVDAVYDAQNDHAYQNTDPTRALRIRHVEADSSGEISVTLHTKPTSGGSTTEIGPTRFSPQSGGTVQIDPTVQVDILPTQFLVVRITNRTKGTPRNVYSLVEGLLIAP